MNVKLHKTLLNQKISRESKIIGALSLLILIALFGMPDHWMQANGDMIFKNGQYWKAFTTTFVHADYKHLAHNAVAFTFLAVLLHNFFGNFVFPFLSVLMGGIINLIVIPFYHPQVYLVGISGVVYFMGAFWLTLYLLIERTTRLKNRIIIAVGLFLIFLAPEAIIKEEVSYLSHAVGFGLGIPGALLYYYFNRHEIRAEDQWIEKPRDPSWIMLEEDLFVEEKDGSALSDKPWQNSSTGEAGSGFH